MSNAERQLLEDRAMRNTARGLVDADIAYIRGSVQQRSIPARFADRLTSTSGDIAGEAAHLARENRAIVGTGVALGVAGMLGWLFRQKIAAALFRLVDGAGNSAGSGETNLLADRSQD